MLTKDISDVLPPGQGFIRPYVEYASQCFDAPEIYHVGVGLTIFASAVAKHLACPWMAGRALVPNLYTLLVGPSRSARKTGSMDAGISILQAVSNELVMPIPGSYEELVNQIRATPSGLLTYREFAHFLKTTTRGYGEPIRTILMDLYDWPPNRSYTRVLRKGKTVIEPPICLSMMSAIDTNALYAYSDLEEWTSGFFGRMVILYGERDVFRLPATWDAAANRLQAALHNYTFWPGWNPCGGFSPNAWAHLGNWALWRDSTTNTFPPRVQTFVAGTATLAAKVALLYAADQGEAAAGPGWLISEDSMRRATLFVDKLYLPSIFLLGDKLTNGPWERDRQKILDYIEARPQGVLRSDILRHCKVSAPLLDDVTDTLKQEKTITQGQSAGGITYRRVREGGGSGGGGGGQVVPITSALNKTGSGEGEQ